MAHDRAVGSHGAAGVRGATYGCRARGGAWFLTQDPIGLAGGVNLYAYAGSNPVAFLDPLGLKVHLAGGRERQAYEQGKAQMTACANSAQDGPCNAQEANDAAQGLAYLAAAEADPTMHIVIKFKPLKGSPFGVEALSDFDRVVYLDPGNESAFGRDRDKASYDLASVVVHEVHEAYGAMTQFGNRLLSGEEYRRVHDPAVRYAENPALLGGGFSTRTSRSPGCNVGLRPNPLGSRRVCP